MQNSLLHGVWTEMCVGSVCTQPPYNDKNPPSAFFKSPQIISTFSDQAVHIFWAKWRSFVQALPMTIDWQYLPEWAVNSPPMFRRWSRSRQEWLLSDWGVLLLDVIMNIAVIIYSRNLSCWRRSELLLFLKGISPQSSNDLQWSLCCVPSTTVH